MLQERLPTKQEDSESMEQTSTYQC
uniref:Uncharacterized protein n=1 Tax=Arundo donax TaxID=35708 RepID=A0A0A8YKV2_ARUDO